jgi:hypothetical protein
LVFDNCTTYGITQDRKDIFHKSGIRLKTKAHIQAQGAIFKGLRLRLTEFDSNKPPLILSSCDDLEVVCDDYVMTTPRSSDDCDDCDGLKTSTAFGHKKAVNYL